MKNLRYSLFCLLAISVGVAVLGATGPDNLAAHEVWERVIAAKGGRDRLREVSNLVLSATSRWGIRGINAITVHYETFLVLPGQLWDWLDERPSKFGLRLQIVDLGRDYEQMIYDGSNGLMPVGKVTIGRVQDIRELQAVTLLETRWMQPALVALRDRRWGLRHFRVVETTIDEQTFEYYLDRQTNLPVRVVVKTPTPFGVHETDYRLSNYAEVAGLQLPRTVTRNFGLGTFKQVIEYQINVEYDPEIFRNPPSLQGGPKGWQRLER